jgi:hypothetical protein
MFYDNRWRWTEDVYSKLKGLLNDGLIFWNMKTFYLLYSKTAESYTNTNFTYNTVQAPTIRLTFKLFTYLPSLITVYRNCTPWRFLIFCIELVWCKMILVSIWFTTNARNVFERNFTYLIPVFTLLFLLRTYMKQYTSIT